jgi:uncharacterized protein YegP (UPF0339 family)
MAGKFELYRDKAGNGEIIAGGEADESKTSAKNGVESVKRTPPVPRSSI